MLGVTPTYDIAIWHGFTLPVVMSLIALAGGTLLYSLRYRLFAAHARYIPPVSGEGFFERVTAALVALADRVMARVDNRSLQRYLFWLLVTALVLTATPFVLEPIPLDGGLAGEPLDWVSVASAVLLAVAAVAVAWLRGLVTLIMTSVVGLVVALAFVHFSAPDLALTQLTVEVVTTILLLLVLYMMPTAETRRPRRARTGDVLIAGLAGVGTAALAYAMMTRPVESISDYFLAYAKPEGGGTNVVNVILVDFRGFDTLGEIAVLGIAAIGIYAMLGGLRLKAPTQSPGGRPWAADAHPLILAMLSRPLLPLALLVSAYILLRGHNEPGGGFIAGLVTGTALILQQLASGQGWTEERLRITPSSMIGGGLALAAGTGVAAMVFGRPFLTSAVAHLHLPLIGEVELASAMAFDVGVFLVVVGTVRMILENLGSLTSGRVLAHPGSVLATGQERRGRPEAETDPVAGAAGGEPR
jgi:multicomponent K+:H+ antiporter subunit A